MAENSYRSSIDQAVKDIDRIENKLLELATQIEKVGDVAKKNLGALTPKTPGDVDKQLKQVQKALQDIEKTQQKADGEMRKREAALKRQADLQYKFANEKAKAEERNFKQLAKASQIQKKAVADSQKLAEAELKVKKAREAAISKRMTGRMTEYVKSIGRTNDGLRKMNSYYAQLEQSTKKVTTAEQKAKQVREKAISRQLTGQMKEYVNSIGKTSDGLRKMNSYYKDLEKTTAREAREREKASAAARKQAGAYEKLVAKQQQAKRILRELIASESKNTNRLKFAQREYDKYTAKVNRANAATQNFAKKGLGSAVIGIQNLMGAFGIVGGLYLFADMAKQGFRLAKQLDSLNFAMKTIITDSNELSRTQAFLADITERYGASIVTTTERYIKFLAAAKQSNVTLEDTEKIFGTMTKAAGALGLKTHELEGVYLALEQMLSKGKVTTEELRRQLGERLPGAFGIMADALGVSVSELDKMLRKGEILSGEVLPKFAEQVEKAYGLENLNKVENLNAATNRLSNSWVEFVRTITESEGAVSKTITFLIDKMAETMKGFNIMISTSAELELQANNRLETSAYKEGLEEIKNQAKETGDSIEEIASKSSEANGDIVTGIKETIKALKEENKEIESRTGLERWLKGGKGNTQWRENAEAISEASKRLALYNGYLRAAIELQGGDNKDKEEAIDRGRTYADVLADISEQQAFLQDSLKEEAPMILAKIAALKEEAAAWELTNKKKKESKEIIEGSLDALQNVKSELEDERDRLATTGEQREVYNKKIEETEAKIWKLVEAYDDLKEQERIYGNFSNEGTAAGNFGSENDINGYQQFLRDKNDAEKDSWLDSYDFAQHSWQQMLSLAENAADEEVRIEMEKQARLAFLREKGVETVGKLNEEQIAAVDKLMQAQLEIESNFKDARRDLIVEGADAVMQARVEEVEEDIALNRERYATILDSQEWSEEQRDAIEAERERKEVELEKKKRKREKEAFLVKQGMAVAEIAIDTFKKVAMIKAEAAVLAANPITAAYAPIALSMIPMVIGTAAMQTGLILAQSIPKFEKGTENAPEGVALVDEKRPEVHLDKHGNVKSWGQQGANLRYLEKGDKIVPSHQEFFNSQNMQKAVWDMNMSSNGAELSQSQVDYSLLREMSGMRKDMDRMGRRMEKMASRPINVNNKVTIQDSKPY